MRGATGGTCKQHRRRRRRHGGVWASHQALEVSFSLRTSSSRYVRRGTPARPAACDACSRSRAVHRPPCGWATQTPSPAPGHSPWSLSTQLLHPERYLLRDCFRAWVVFSASSQQAGRALRLLRQSRGQGEPEPESASESGAAPLARSRWRRAKRTSQQRQKDKRQRQATALLAGQAAMARERRRQQLVMRPGPDGRERLVLLWRLWQKYMVIVTMRRVAVAVREDSRFADGGAFLSEVRRALASERWGFPAAMGDALTAVEFFHPEGPK